MLNEATTTAPPPSRTPRRWLRRGTLISLIALALLAGEGYRRHRNWQNFLRDVRDVGGDVDFIVSRNPEFEKWGIHEWILDRIPLVRKTAALRLTDNRINDRWLLKHAHALHSTCIFSIDLQSDEVTDEGLKVLRDHPTLHTLSFKGKLYSADCLTALGQLRNLSRLYLPDVSLSEVSVKQLADWPNVLELACDADSTGLSELGDLRRLFLLHLTHASDESLSRIDVNSSMHFLVVQQSTITDASIPQLLGFPQLRDLMGERFQFSEEGAAKLKSAGFRIYLPTKR